MTSEPSLPSDEFSSWLSYQHFAREVSHHYRYLHSPETEAFLAAVQITCQSRKVTIDAGQRFWRAQVGHDWRPMDSESGTDDEIPCAYLTSRMKPLSDRASDGRANPRGIPTLYLATTKETAMSEVRPWIGAYVSCGQFQTNRPLTVIDCARRHNENPLHFDLEDPNYEPSPEAKTRAVWANIDRAFAEPMTRSDDLADYVPTQVLAELFKQAGADGVVYKSKFGDDGFNIALFDPASADLINCGLFQVEGLQFSFKEADQFGPR